MRITSLLAAAAAAVVFALPSGAATLSGVFEIDIYSYDSGGSSSKAAATLANVSANAGNFAGTITYRGALDFRIDTRRGPEGGTPLITQFLDTGSGSYTVDQGDISGLILSSGGGSNDPRFGQTTLFDIVARSLDTPFTRGFSGEIAHDDGITVLQDGRVIAGYSRPTWERRTSYSFDGNEFRLLYTSANGDPSLLEVGAAPAPIPLPAPALMLLTACCGLGLLARWRTVATPS